MMLDAAETQAKTDAMMLLESLNVLKSLRAYVDTCLG
jgi:hypothetical protein